MRGAPRRGEQSLADARPDLAAEWHPTRNGDLTPGDVSRSSSRLVWWRCRQGHEWQTSPNAREKSGCAVCGGKRVLAGFNDLATVEPAIAAEWHPTRNGDLTPEQVTAGSGKRVWWLCPVAPDHEWQVSVSNRTTPAVRSGCAVCAGRVVVPSTSLATLFPDVALEWHPIRNGDLTADAVTPFVTKRVWWRCTRGHEWQVAIAARTRQGTGCPNCSSRVAVPGETDLATTKPDLAAEWHPTRNGHLTPEEVRPGSKRPIWWRCSVGHEWRTTPSNRVTQTSGCPYCAGQRPVPGETDLGTTHPDLAAELHPTRNGNVTAADLMGGTTRKVWWLCAVGHEWSASVDPRSRGVGCPICANKQVLAGYNDLATTDPRLATELHPTRNNGDVGQQVTRMSGRKMWWQCADGHEWQSTVANRTLGNGCPVCANKQVLAGFNDLATVAPDIAAEWHPKRNGDLTPQQVTSGSNRKVWWQCGQGHEWRTVIGNRAGGSGCPSCAAYGFNPAVNAWLYLLTHDDWNAQQIGITNTPDVRLATHRRNGWQVLDVRGPMPGDLAAALERDALTAISRRGARLGQRGDAHRFDGYTEAWPVSSLRVESLGEILRLIHTDESS